MGNGYRTDTNVNMSDKEATVFNSLPPWFGCFCYLLVGLSVSLVYVLSEVDYLMLSGVFRAQRFFSDDPFYFSKQVLIVYGFVGFLVTILVGPIGRLPCVLWSWALSCAYFCLSFYVFLYSFSQYGRFMMFALALLSVLSHVLLANFVFFLFDGGAYDFRLPRCFAFLIGFFAGSPLVSFLLFRLKLCFTTSTSYEFKLKTFDVFRLLTTLFSLAMLSSVCLTYEFFAYGDNNYSIEWAPAKRVRAPVRAIAQFVDGEVVVLLFLLCPMWVDLGQYAAQSHGDWVEARLGHKAMFAVALIALLLWTFASAWQLCVQTINEINAAIFKVMFTDGYLQLKDENIKERPVSVTSLPNYKPYCKSGKKTKNTLKIPGPVMYPYLPDTWDDAENEDKLLLSMCLKMLNGIDSMSHYLETGSTAELCRLTNDLNLKDCWLESQDPLALIGHVLNEYTNTLSALLGNSVNLHNANTSFCEFNRQYLRYLLYFHKYYTTRFPYLFERIKPALDYFKNCFKNEIRCLSRYICSYLNYFNDFNKELLNVHYLLCNIEDTLGNVEHKIHEIKNEWTYPQAFSTIFSYLNISTEQSKLDDMCSKLRSLKTKLCEIRCVILTNKGKSIIEHLNSVNSKLPELDVTDVFNANSVQAIYEVVVLLRKIWCCRASICQLISCLQQHSSIDSHLQLEFSFFSVLESLVFLSIKFFKATFQGQDPQSYFKFLKDKITHVNTTTRCLTSKICEITKKQCKVRCFFTLSRYLLLKFACIKRFLHPVELPIATFLRCSIKTNITQLNDLIRRINRSQTNISEQKTPDILSQSLITLRTYITDALWFVFSHRVALGDKLVVSRFYRAFKYAQVMLGNMSCVNECRCSVCFKTKCINFRLLHRIYYFSIDNTTDYLDHVLHDCPLDNTDNHLCLCIIINYILYPKLITCLCTLLVVDLHVLSSLTRKFDIYSAQSSQLVGTSKILLLTIELFLKITNCIRRRYICSCDKNGDCKRDKKCDPKCVKCTLKNQSCRCQDSANSGNCYCNCFCICYDDPYYLFFFSLILYICSLIEDIQNIDNIGIEGTVQNLSLLMLEFGGSVCDSIKRLKFDSACGSEITQSLGTFRNTEISVVKAYMVVSNALIIFAISLEDVSINFDRQKNQGVIATSMEKTTTSIRIKFSELSSFYQRFFGMFFFLMENKNISVKSRSFIRDTNLRVAQIYLRKNELKTIVISSSTTKISTIRCICITLGRCFIDLCARQSLNNVMMKVAHEHQTPKYSNQTANGMINYGMDMNSKLSRLGRNARIIDATCRLANTSNTHMTDLNPKYYVSDKVFRPSACFGFGYFKFVITRFFLVVFLILMFWFLRFRFDPFVPAAFSQLRNYDYAATSAHLTSLIAKSQNAANDQSPSDVADVAAGNVGVAKPLLKKAKHFVLIAAFAAVSAVYITLVIRDIYVAVTVDFATLSYLINVAIVCGMFMTLFIKYFIHLYDFVQVLQRYGVKLTRASTFLETAAHGGSHAVMLLSLVKTMGADLTSLAMLKRPRTSSSSYSEMKNALYPYNTMSAPIRRMTTADSDHLKELEGLRQSLLASLGDAKKIDYRTNRSGKKADKSAGTAGNTLDLHSVLDFLSYVLMSKTSAFHYHTFSADDAYLSWRLGRPLNHNFFLLAYARYTAVYELYARIVAFNFGQFYTAEQNCNRLWRAFGDAQIDAITLKCISEDALSTPMTHLQTQMLKAKISEEYLQSFLGFQSFVASTAFGVKDKSAGSSNDTLFPFVHAFNKLELDSELVTRLAFKFFGDNQRKVSAGVAVPSSTCSVDGDAQRVRDRLKDSCAEWLDKKRQCCESLAGAGCDCIVHRAHDMVLRAIAEPGDVRNNIVTLVAGLNLEDVEVLDKTFDSDVGAKRALKDFSTTLLEHRSLDAVSVGYESTVAHYLSQFLFLSYENRDRAAVPLGLYMQWHGAPLCDPHLRNVDKFDHFRK